jgi:hypothetical protein
MTASSDPTIYSIVFGSKSINHQSQLEPKSHSMYTLNVRHDRDSLRNLRWECSMKNETQGYLLRESGLNCGSGERFRPSIQRLVFQVGCEE